MLSPGLPTSLSLSPQSTHSAHIPPIHMRALTFSLAHSSSLCLSRWCFDLPTQETSCPCLVSLPSHVPMSGGRGWMEKDDPQILCSSPRSPSPRTGTGMSHGVPYRRVCVCCWDVALAVSLSLWHPIPSHPIPPRLLFSLNPASSPFRCAARVIVVCSHL